MVYNYYSSHGYNSKTNSKERLEDSDSRLTPEERLKAYGAISGKEYKEFSKAALSHEGATEKDLLTARINDSIISYLRGLKVSEKEISSIKNSVNHNIRSAVDNSLSHIADPANAAMRVVAEFNTQTATFARRGIISYADIGYASDTVCKIVPENGACETCQSYASRTYTYSEATEILNGAHPNCKCQIVPVEQREAEEAWISAMNDTFDKLFEKFEDMKAEIESYGMAAVDKWREFTEAVSVGMQKVSVPNPNKSDLVFERIQSNYKENQKIQKEITGLINNQNSGPASEIKMGVGKSKDNGCGWIATYNAMQLLGEPQKPTDIVKYYETNGGIVADGVFGVNSIVMNQYFNSKGIKTEYTPWPSEMDKKIAETGMAVLEYAEGLRWHYITIRFENELFTIYNENMLDKPIMVESIDEWISDKGYLTMFLITAKK